MNYAGKFDATILLDGEGSRSAADVHVDSFTAKTFIAKPFVAKAHGHVPDGTFVVPDANLIFNGEFKRAGLDLVLSHEGHEFVVHDYFKGDKRAAIASPDGAHLTGDVVNALTGHVQVAQAAPGIAAAQVIGHVTKLSGSATAVRNGVSVTLNNGDNVEKGDVVSTGADSTLGITFIDGTVFGLSSNARMVLNEMVYDPNGSSNSSLLSLVAGTITFVAGETAKHGDMKIDTPVATMGIRGTAVLTQINFVVPAGGGDPQPQASFQVLVEPNGTTGSYILFDKVTLLPIATVNQAGQMIQISGGNVSITNGLLSPDVQKLITDVFTLKFTDNNTNTKLTTNFTDTITQTSDGLVIKTPAGYIATALFTNLGQQGPQGPSDHIDAFQPLPRQASVSEPRSQRQCEDGVCADRARGHDRRHHAFRHDLRPHHLRRPEPGRQADGEREPRRCAELRLQERRPGRHRHALRTPEAGHRGDADPDQRRRRRRATTTTARRSGPTRSPTTSSTSSRPAKR